VNRADEDKSGNREDDKISKAGSVLNDSSFSSINTLDEEWLSWIKTGKRRGTFQVV